MRWREQTQTFNLIGFLFLAACPRVDALPAEANREYHIANWRTDNGLPQSSVRSLTQTDDGFLWIGTAGGLARFDGIHFEVFNQANSAALASDEIGLLQRGSQNRLWIVAGDEIHSYIDGRIRRHQRATDVSPSGIRSLAEDRSQDLYIAAANGLYRIRDEVTRELPFSGGNWPTENSHVVADQAGNIWFAHNNELHQWKADSFHLRRHFPSAITALSRGHTNEVICGLADGGVFRLTHEREWPMPASDGKAIRVIATGLPDRVWFADDRLRVFEGDAPPRIILPDARVTSLCRDRKGDIWMGTEDRGMFRLRLQPLLCEADHLDAITSVMQDQAGHVWLGSRRHGHALKIDGQWSSGRVPGSSAALSVYTRRDGTILLGSNGSGAWQLHGRVWKRLEGSRARIVPAFFEDSSGRLWIGSQTEGVEIVPPLPESEAIHQTLKSASVHAFAEAPAGTLWIGTNDGLFRVRDGAIHHFGRDDGLGANRILTLHVDDEQQLWVGTAGGGLSRHRERHFQTVDTRHGLPSNVVSQLLDDGAGHLWIGTNQGLFRVGKETLHAVFAGRRPFLSGLSFGQTEGMRNPECSQGSHPNCLRDREGRLWFATMAGAVAIHPRTLAENDLPPTVHIRRLVSDGQEVDCGNEERGVIAAGIPDRPATVDRVAAIPPNTRRLEIEYAGLNLAAPHSVQFRQRLVGYDEQWTMAGATRTAHFTQLPPGAYRFEVMAADVTGVWNPHPALLSVIVHPAFWQTGWFRALAVLLLLTAALAFHYTRLSRLKQLHDLRLRIARDLHDEVGASIGAISLLSGMSANAAKQASDDSLEEIHEIAQETAHSLREVVWFVTPEFDTLDDLGAHIETVARRLLADKRVDFESRFERGQRRLSLAFRRDVLAITKEALHNIAKHSQASTVVIRALTANGRLALSIEDNGIGYATNDTHQTRPGGNGVKNMKSRAKDLRASFSLDSTPGKGTRIHLETPIT